MKKLATLWLALLVLMVFTAEYGHLIEESVCHLWGQHQGSGQNASHRCHNCATSQPQGETATWSFEPGSIVCIFDFIAKEPPAAPRPLFRLPAKRAPPVY